MLFYSLTNALWFGICVFGLKIAIIDDTVNVFVYCNAKVHCVAL